jgi:putative transposase
MKDGTMILPFGQSESIADPLTELAREGARRMPAEALKAERVNDFETVAFGI